MTPESQYNNFKTVLVHVVGELLIVFYTNTSEDQAVGFGRWRLECRTAPWRAIKGGDEEEERGSRVERTKCCRTDFRASLSVLALSVFCSIAFCCRVSRRLALFRGPSVYVRQHLRPVFLFPASKRTEIGICPPPCSLFVAAVHRDHSVPPLRAVISRSVIGSHL